MRKKRRLKQNKRNETWKKERARCGEKLKRKIKEEKRNRSEVKKVKGKK